MYLEANRDYYCGPYEASSRFSHTSQAQHSMHLHRGVPAPCTFVRLLSNLSSNSVWLYM